MWKHLFLLPLVFATAIVIAQEESVIAETESENWIEIRGGHFTVVTDATEKQGRRIADHFERMRALFEGLYPQLDFDPESPVVVLATKSQKLFRALQPGAYLSKESLQLRGWYLSNSGKRYILLRTDLRGGDPLPVAFHEYTHLALHEASDSMPLWLDEGLGEFYGNTKIQYEKLVLGEPNRHYLTLLRNEKRLPLTTLFAIDENSPDYIEKKRGSIFYAESWALAQYLTLKDYAEKTSAVGRYIELVGEKVDPVSAAVRAFGDLKKLEKALDFHIQLENLRHLEITSVTNVDDSEFDALPIASVQAEAVEADFLACSGRLEEGRVLAAHVLQQDPENSSARATTAFIESAKVAQTELKLRNAIQQDPSSATAFDQLAVFLWKRGSDLDEAKRLASKAVLLDAGNPSHRIDLANILLSAGDEQAAIEMLRAAATVARTAEETAAIDKQLKDVMAYASARAAQKGGPQEKTTITGNDITHSATTSDSVFAVGGRHRFLVGVLKAVHCDPPMLDLTVTSQTGSVLLHSENYYQIEFTSLFASTRDLKPCDDLENRPAKVEYVESANGGLTPRLVAVELHK